MHQPGVVADAFGVVTISLVSIFMVLGLFCIVYLIYFHLQIRRYSFPQLAYFDGPFIIRISLIVLAIWWTFGEILRLSILNGKGRIFTVQKLQSEICKFYVISNIGFAEPCFLLILANLLHASLQKGELDALNNQWNRKTFQRVLLFCLPLLLLQLVLVLIGHKLSTEVVSNGMNIPKYFTSTSSLAGDSITCTYPLLNTILLGLFDSILIIWITCLGFNLVTSVINKLLLKRIYLLIISITGFLPLRITLLGVSVLPQPGGLVFEALVFLAFAMLLCCISLAVCVFVYHPVADSLALRGLRRTDIEETPFDDYYDGTSSLAVNQSLIETGRNSDASTKRSSISLRTMVNDAPHPSNGCEGVENFSPGTFRISSSLESPPLFGRSFRPLLSASPEY